MDHEADRGHPRTLTLIEVAMTVATVLHFWAIVDHKLSIVIILVHAKILILYVFLFSKYHAL